MKVRRSEQCHARAHTHAQGLVALNPVRRSSAAACLEHPFLFEQPFPLQRFPVSEFGKRAAVVSANNGDNDASRPTAAPLRRVVDDGGGSGS
jgi:hypothetical protein